MDSHSSRQRQQLAIKPLRRPAADKRHSNQTGPPNLRPKHTGTAESTNHRAFPTAELQLSPVLHTLPVLKAVRLDPIYVTTLHYSLHQGQQTQYSPQEPPVTFQAQQLYQHGSRPCHPAPRLVAGRNVSFQRGTKVWAGKSTLPTFSAAKMQLPPIFSAASSSCASSEAGPSPRRASRRITPRVAAQQAPTTAAGRAKRPHTIRAASRGAYVRPGEEEAATQQCSPGQLLTGDDCAKPPEYPTTPRTGHGS